MAAAARVTAHGRPAWRSAAFVIGERDPRRGRPGTGRGDTL